MDSVLTRIKSFVLFNSSKRRRLPRWHYAAIEQLEMRELLTVSFETLADFEHTNVQSSNPHEFVFGDTIAYFQATTIANGEEIWRTDGTNAGTFLLRDIVPGPESPAERYANSLTVVGDTAFFRLRSPLGDDFKLWRSDGTSVGTQIVRMSDGSDVVNPDNITADNGLILFTAMESTGRNLYRLDPTAGAFPIPIATTEGSKLPYARNTGLSTSTGTFFSVPYSLAPSTSGQELLIVRPDSNVTESVGTFLNAYPYKAISDRLIFSGLSLTDSIQARHRWWITDGTVAGTHELNLPASVVPETITLADDGSIMFMATGSGGAWQVWKTDGSEHGATEQFAVGNGAEPSSLLGETATNDGRIFFKVFSGPGAGKIWQTDGTQAGTFALAATAGVDIRDLKGSFQNGVVFEGFTFPTPNTIYYVDSSLAEPVDLVPGAGSTIAINSFSLGVGPNMILGNLFSQKTGGEPGVANATTPFTLLKDIQFGTGSSFPGQFVATDNSVVFNDKFGLAKTDGTVNGTVLYKQIGQLFAALPNGYLFARAPQSNSGFLLVQAPGSSNWIPFEQIAPSSGAINTKFLATVGNQLFYLAGLTSASSSLWVTDGTTAGTHMISNGSSPFRDVTIATSFGDHQLLFQRNPLGQARELWVTDRTVNGTRKLLELGAPDFFDHITTSFHKLGDRMIVFDPVGVSAITDGTVSGTARLDGLPATMLTGYLKWFGDADGYAYFSVLTDSSAVEFWRTDGTVVGTQFIRVIHDHLSIREGQQGIDITDGVTAGGLVYFFARDMQGKADIWVSDGTASGTRILKSNLTGRIDTEGIHDIELYSEFGRLFFIATDVTPGRRLWTSDGTEVGTQLVVTATGNAPPYVEIAFNPGMTVGSELIAFRGALYYAGITDAFGMEPVKLTSDTIDQAPKPVFSQSGGIPSLHWTEVFGAESYDIQFVRIDTGGKTNINIVGDHWKLPPLAADGIYRIWMRGRRFDGTVGPWNSEPFDLTSGTRPVLHSSAVLTEDKTPTIFWASPAGTTSSEVWISDLESKQRVSYSLTSGSRSHFDSPQLNPSRYAAWVRTSGSYGTSEWSLATVFTVLIPAPQNLSVEVNPQRVMTIHWSPVDGATDYEIYVRGSKSAIPLINRYGIGAVTSFQVSGMVPGDLYSISVRARRPGRPQSAWTPVLTTFIPEAPKAVVSLHAIRWTAIGQAVGYELKMIDLNSGKEVENKLLTTTTYQLNQNPGRYELQLRTKYRDGSTTEWAKTTFEIFHPAIKIFPAPQPSVDATPVITWIAQARAGGYEIYVQRAGQSTAAYRVAGITETTHRIAVPLPNGNYQVWIRSHYMDGSRSQWGAATALAVGIPPVVVAGNRAVTWAAVTGATKYDIIIQIAGKSADSYVDYLRINDAVQTTVSLATAPAGTYRVWVRAKRNEAGSVYLSNWSSIVRFDLT